MLIDGSRAADRTGSAGAVDGDRSGARNGAGVQQMGSRRRGPAVPNWRSEIDRELAQVQWASRVNISAKTGRAVQKLVPAMENCPGVLGQADLDRTAEHLPQGDRRRDTAAGARGQAAPILFATQATARPPTFVLFTSGFLEAGYRRFIERRLARDVRLRRQPDPDQRAGTGEARHPRPLVISV